MAVLSGRDVAADGVGRLGPKLYTGAVVAAAPGGSCGDNSEARPLAAARRTAYPLLWTAPVAVAAAT